MQHKNTIRDLCLIAVFAAVIAVMAQIVIPMPWGVPFTMQTFAVPLAGAILGAKKGITCAIVYLLLGAVGVPVFAGFGAGLDRFIGPWGGYLWSYPLFAFVVGFGADQSMKIQSIKGKFFWLASGLLAGSVINLTMGMIQFAVVSGANLQAAFIAAVAPFLIGEFVKLSLVFMTAPKIRKTIGRLS